jgi:hypothetical protein
MSSTMDSRGKFLRLGFRLLVFRLARSFQGAWDTLNALRGLGCVGARVPQLQVLR